MKRIAAFALALLLMCPLTSATTAAESVFFTAVNDKLLDLSDETMPFWSNGILYVSSAAFRDTDLNVKYTRVDRKTVVLYNATLSQKMLIFNLDSGTAMDVNGKDYGEGAIGRGDHAFFPVTLLLRYFGLDYSYVKIDCGYLLRIKSEAVVLDDESFIDAATTLLVSRYNQYVRAHTPTETSAAPAEETASAPQGETRVYLAVRASGGEKTQQLMDTLRSYRVTAALFWTAQEMEQSGDLLRCAAASGYATGIRTTQSDIEGIRRDIEQANALLRRHTGMKTRLIYASEASSAVLEELRGEGYCCFEPTLDYSTRSYAGTAQLEALSAAAAKRAQCMLDLGTDEKAADVMGRIILQLRRDNCTFAKLNETVR